MNGLIKIELTEAVGLLINPTTQKEVYFKERYPSTTSGKSFHPVCDYIWDFSENTSPSSIFNVDFYKVSGYGDGGRVEYEY